MYHLKSHFSLATLCALLCCFSFIQSAQAQIPKGINYQAVARDTAGQPIGNSSLTVEITVADTSSLDVNEYIESHSVLTNRFGLFTLVIGEGNLVSGSALGDFDEIDWSSEKWLGVTIGGVDMGVTELVSVPFALYAERAGNIVTIDSSRLVGNDYIIYQSNGQNDTTDFASFIPETGDTIDTVAIIGDTLLRIVERGDTFNLDISSLFNNDTNELIDSIRLDLGATKLLELFEGADTASISLAPLSDTFTQAEIVNGDLRLVLSSDTNDTSIINLSAFLNNDTNELDSFQFAGVVQDSIKTETQSTPSRLRIFRTFRILRLPTNWMFLISLAWCKTLSSLSTTEIQSTPSRLQIFKTCRILHPPTNWMYLTSQA